MKIEFEISDEVLSHMQEIASICNFKVEELFQVLSDVFVEEVFSKGCALAPISDISKESDYLDIEELLFKEELAEWVAKCFRKKYQLIEEKTARLKKISEKFSIQEHSIEAKEGFQKIVSLWEEELMVKFFRSTEYQEKDVKLENFQIDSKVILLASALANRYKTSIQDEMQRAMEVAKEILKKEIKHAK